MLQRKTPVANYSDQEKQVLLTGVPASCKSTRFGHPSTGWNREAIREAWKILAAELLVEWEFAKYDHYRERGPFAARFLEQPNDHYPFRMRPDDE
jgi:hypothetical protein